MVAHPVPAVGVCHLVLEAPAHPQREHLRRRSVALASAHRHLVVAREHTHGAGPRVRVEERVLRAARVDDVQRDAVAAVVAVHALHAGRVVVHVEAAPTLDGQQQGGELALDVVQDVQHGIAFDAYTMCSSRVLYNLSYRSDDSMPKPPQPSFRSALSRLGLGRHESALYATLVERSPLGASELARITGLAPQQRVHGARVAHGHWGSWAPRTKKV
jgi:hypothetical protein